MADSRTCWICFSGDDTITIGTDRDDVWCTPCLCRGTARYVHRTCLESFINARLQQQPLTRVACPQCLTAYVLRVEPYRPWWEWIVKVRQVTESIWQRRCVPLVCWGVVSHWLYQGLVAYGKSVVLTLIGDEAYEYDVQMLENPAQVGWIRAIWLRSLFASVPLALVSLRYNSWQSIMLLAAYPLWSTSSTVTRTWKLKSVPLTRSHDPVLLTLLVPVTVHLYCFLRGAVAEFLFQNDPFTWPVTEDSDDALIAFGQEPQQPQQRRIITFGDVARCIEIWLWPFIGRFASEIIWRHKLLANVSLSIYAKRLLACGCVVILRDVLFGISTFAQRWVQRHRKVMNMPL